MKLGFDVVGGTATEGGVPTFGIVVSDVMADFEPGFGQAREMAAVEQFRLEAAPKGLGLGVVVAVAAAALRTHGPVPVQEGAVGVAAVLAAPVGVDE